jgi:hypothetical protein
VRIHDPCPGPSVIESICVKNFYKISQGATLLIGAVGSFACSGVLASLLKVGAAPDQCVLAGMVRPHLSEKSFESLKLLIPTDSVLLCPAGDGMECPNAVLLLAIPFDQCTEKEAMEFTRIN